MRGHAVVLAIALWLTALVVVARPGAFDRNGLLKGVDFLQFYVAGQVVRDGDAGRLYDWDAFAARIRSAVPGTGDLLFLSVYPPQVAVAFAPLGSLSYLAALSAWSALSVTLYGLAAALILRGCPALQRHGLTWWVAVVGFVPFQQAVLHGQLGTVVFAIVTLAWVALRADRMFWFGAALGSLAFKPQFGVAALLALLVTRDVRVLAGVLAAGLVQIGASMLVLGFGPWGSYLQQVPVILEASRVFEPKLWKMQNLRGFIELLGGSGVVATVLYACAAVAVAALVARAWRRTTSADLRLTLLVLASALVNPHLYVYDLVVVGLPLALLVAWALDHADHPMTPLVLTLVHVLAWVPLVAPLAAFTRLQVTAPVLLLLLAVVSVLASSDTEAPETATT